MTTSRRRYDPALELQRSAEALVRHLGETGQVCATFSHFHPGAYKVPQGAMIFLCAKRVGSHWVVWNSLADTVYTILDTPQDVARFARELTGAEHQGWLPDYSKRFDEGDENAAHAEDEEEQP